MAESLQPLDADFVRDVLRTVIDPETDLNIIDLGLVYGIHIDEGLVHVRMTLTSPACPMGDMILEDVDVKLRKALPKGFRHHVEVVWEPAWEPSLMSEAARADFGW
jgi:metal-sulfur cluster biosynthetic enzyme